MSCVEVGIVWQESTRCVGGDCVNVGFRKSVASLDNATCVEVNCQCHEGDVLVRDSKNVDGPVLRFTTDEWAAFIAGAKAGQFDLAKRSPHNNRGGPHLHTGGGV